MREQDLTEFAKLIVGIGELYGKSFTSTVIEIYWRILKAYKFEDVRDAIYRHIENPDNGKYTPKPSDIIMAIDGNSYSQALTAWTKVVSAIHSVGCYSSIAFDDTLIHSVIEDMGGWQELCRIQNERLPFVAKEFQERYQGYVVRKPSNHPKYFIGIIEHKNSPHGYMCGPPILFGDAKKAQQVIETGRHASLSINSQLLLNDAVNTLDKY